MDQGNDGQRLEEPAGQVFYVPSLKACYAAATPWRVEGAVLRPREPAGRERSAKRSVLV